MQKHTRKPAARHVAARQTGLALLTLALFNSGAQAAMYCVSSDTEFYSALYQAAASAEDDELRFDQALLNIYFNFGSPNNINGDLALRGGYDYGCVGRADRHTMTQIKALNRSLELRPLQTSNIFIERMGFDGHSIFAIHDILDANVVDNRLILVSRSIFRNANEGLKINATRHNVRVENSLFINNIKQLYGTGTGLTISSYFDSQAQEDSQVSVVNCTLRGNTNGLRIDNGLAGPNSYPRIVNVISTGNVLDIDLRRITEVRNSLYKSLSISVPGALSASSGNNLKSSPLLDINHRPTTGSPAIDAGDNAVVSMPSDAEDYYGNRRIVGNTVDRGAVETNKFWFW